MFFGIFVDSYEISMIDFGTAVIGRQGGCMGKEENRIFVRDRFEALIAQGDGRIVSFGCYRQRRFCDGYAKTRDVRFGEWVLALKKGNSRAIEGFARLLGRELGNGVAFCVVPSHRASGRNMSGIARAVRKAAANGRVDAVDALIRVRTVDELSVGGCRERKVHYGSIVYNDRIDLSGMTVILIDDITTSGNSLAACRDIFLRDSGASRCVMVALAQTDRSHFYGWDRNELLVRD